MMKRIVKYSLSIVILLLLSAGILSAENILKILEGYGRDSISTFSTRSAHSEAARLFNLILESNGKTTAEKAEDFLSSAKSKEIKAYLAVMLADYSFVNSEYDSGIRYLKRAIEEHDPIRNDSYYRSVLDRAQKDIKESPGKSTGKTSILTDFNPPAIKEEPTPVQKTISPPSENNIETEPSKPPVVSAIEPNFRIQVGAYSSIDNAERIKQVFEERGYTVKVDKRERTNGYLYLVRVGAYDSYDQAKQALVELKLKYPSEDGIVIKVEK